MDFKFPDPCAAPPVFSYLEQSMKLSHRLPTRALSQERMEYYAPTFDSDDEDDESEWEDEAEDAIIFERRHISRIGAAKNRRSLLTIALTHEKEAVARREMFARRNYQRYNGPSVHFMDEFMVEEDDETESMWSQSTEQLTASEDGEEEVDD